MAINTRAFVGAPTKEPLTYGLFSVAEIRSEPMSSGRVDPHWKNGVTWQNVCPDGSTTYDQCIQAGALGTDLGSTPAAKAATAMRSSWGATPFTVLVEVDCTPVGNYWELADAIIGQTFSESEAFEVESVFMSGVAGGDADIVFPHLTAESGLLDGTVTLQLATANVGPTGGTPLDVVEALGKLEQALSACVKGVGVVHVPCELLPHLVAQHLLREEGGVYYTPAGHRVAVSAAYTGASPAGEATANVLWMYGTGPVFIYRDRGAFVGDNTQSLDRTINTLKRIYERTYVIGYDCCLFGVAVSTGGITTGTPESAF